MKRSFLVLFSLFLINYSYAQTYNPDFLDGRIMFKIKGEAAANKYHKTQTDPNIFSLEESLSDYPELKSAFEGIAVTKFERPSYFTNKKELIKIYRVTFSDFYKNRRPGKEAKHTGFY